MSHDVVGIGEAMVRLSAPRGTRLDNSPSFEIHVGGAEANVAVAVARMGRRSAWLTRLPANPLGHRVASEIAHHGVDTSAVAWSENDRMGLYFVEMGNPPRPTSVLYDRTGSAAQRMGPADVDWSVVRDARAVHLTGITPVLSSSCHRVVAEAIKEARRSNTLVSFDVNYRSKLWSPQEARVVLESLVEGVDLLLSTIEDARDVFGVVGEATAVASGLAERFAVDRVVVTSGSDGAAWVEAGTTGFTEAYRATEVDRVGAGDAFAAGVLLGLLDDDLASGVKRGLAMAAIKIGIKGDHLITDPAEVEAVINDRGRAVGR